MTAAMSRSRGADQETLMRETLALLGGGRMTEGVRSVLVRTYQDTTSHGPLRSAAPSIAASATALQISLMHLIASSFTGIGYVS